MLLTTDWHPWFSYEWWNDIGVPGLGALGSIAVGAGAIAVALHSNRISQSASQREADALSAARSTAERASRGEFGMVATEWVDTTVDQALTRPFGAYLSASGGVSGGVSSGRSAASYRSELDLKAAVLGQHSPDLISTIDKQLRQGGGGTTSKDRTLLILAHRYSVQSIQAWVADPDGWWDREQAARRQGRKMRAWAGMPPTAD